MLRKNRYEPNEGKLNLIPIMDAVFIFIFFLLFSAQFIKMFEIETDAPIVSQTPQIAKPDEDPLNLKIKILESKIEVTTGQNEKIVATLIRSSKTDIEKLKTIVLDLRKRFPDDDYAILAPVSSIPYEDIIEVIDLIQTLPEGMKTLNLEVKGKSIEKKKIFTQVVLEPLDEA